MSFPKKVDGGMGLVLWECYSCDYPAAIHPEIACGICKDLDKGTPATDVDDVSGEYYPDHPRLESCVGCGEYAHDFEKKNPGVKWKRMLDGRAAPWIDSCSGCNDEVLEDLREMLKGDQ